ncbi:inner centromere protein-like [Asterias rubens]|uniref:inner centromere protein-like n=1 Tax=Asterias rubens TaxID=7604 RepID=UPI001455598A|nr:inner centromere protein-like [Asterias rubens]
MTAMLPSALTMDELPGFSLHLMASAKILKFEESWNANMKWLADVLEDAKHQFGREEVAIFPKTPAMKRRRQRIKRVSTIHPDNVENQLPVRNKRSCRASILSKDLQSIAPVRRSARASRTTITTQNNVKRTTRSRSTRASKKVTMLEHQGSSEQIPVAHSTDTGSCTDDTEDAESVSSSSEVKPKRSEKMSTNAPMETDECKTKVTSGDDAIGVLNSPNQKILKRSSGMRAKQQAKKLRLNSGEGISTISDTSDDCDAGKHRQSIPSSGQSQPDLVGPTESSPSKRPKRKNAASRYKDHVKRLINRHEHLISEVSASSDEEFQSPNIPKRTCKNGRKPKQTAKSVERHLKSQTQEKEEIVTEQSNDKAVSQIKKTHLSENNCPKQSIQTNNEGEIIEIQDKPFETVSQSKRGSSVKIMESTSYPPKEPEVSQDSELKPSIDSISEDEEETHMEEDSLNLPSVAKDSLEQPRIAKDSIEQPCIAKDSIEQPSAAKSSLEQPSIAKDSLEEPSIAIDSLEQPSIAKDSLEQPSIVVDSLEQHSIAIDRLEQHSIAINSLEQHSIAKDSLEPDPIKEENEKEIQKNNVNQDDHFQNQGNMTIDSLDQQNISEDSLCHSNISHDSLNQSSLHQGYQKNLRRSTRRSSAVVSHSKKRSSMYNHRTSIRKSVRKSSRCLHSTRASTRLSRRPHLEELPQDPKYRDNNSDVVLVDAFMEEDPESGTPEMNPTCTTPSRRMSMRHSSDNQGTQRITRATSRMADHVDLPNSIDSTSLSQTPDSDRESPSRKSPGASCSSDEDVISNTPSPRCPKDKIVRPRGTFLSSTKKESSKYMNNLHGMVSSFIKRNTPQKLTATERQREMKKQILSKHKREEEIRRKMETDKQRQREEQKRKRDERIRKVTEARERRVALQEQKRQELEIKQQQLTKMSSKQREDKKQEEIIRRQMQIKKKAEAEERRRQEEEARLLKIQEQEEEQKRHREMILRKKEYEEQERQRRIDEARRLQEQRRADTQKQRQEEQQRRLEQDLAKEREMQLLKEEREQERKAEMELKREIERRAREEALENERRLEAARIAREKERLKEQRHLVDMMQAERKRLECEQERERAEHERLKASILKHNTSACLNTTVTKDTSVLEGSPSSYNMTPQRVVIPSTAENYNIDDLHSGDSTDEEDAPRKNIPSWAQGARLKNALIKQCYNPPPNLETMFGPFDPPDLTLIFSKKRARYIKRTSSAVWDSPLLKV